MACKLARSSSSVTRKDNIAVSFTTKFVVPRQIKLGILKLTIKRGQSNFGIVFITVSYEEKDYYHVDSVGRLSFARRSHCGCRNCMQENGCHFIVLGHKQGCREVKWKYSIYNKLLAFASLISPTLYRWESPYLVHVAQLYMALTSAYCVSVWRLVGESEDLCPPCPENSASSAYCSSPGWGFLKINIFALILAVHYCRNLTPSPSTTVFRHVALTLDLNPHLHALKYVTANFWHRA